MNLPLKFLKQDSEPFVPVTAAEAVMVEHITGVKRLDEVLKFKIEEIVTPVGSGLTSYRSNAGVTIAHSNLINPSTEELKPKLIKYDNRGHLVETADVGTLKVKVNNNNYVDYNGSTSSVINFGDDFQDNNGEIQIRWNTIT